MKSKSRGVVGVSIGSAKYRQHLAVQYVHSESPGGRSSRRIRPLFDLPGFETGIVGFPLACANATGYDLMSVLNR